MKDETVNSRAAPDMGCRRHRDRSWLSSTILSTLLAIGAGAAPSFAQSVPATASTPVDQSPAHANKSSLEEVVVTAQRRAQKLQDVPIAVTALSAAQIQAQGVRSLADISIATPALLYTDNSDYSNVHIRGVGNNFAGNPGIEAPVAQYEDGVPLESGLGAAVSNVLDLDNLEVLEGPQGSLYGRNATGGALLVNTANPVAGQFGHVYAEYGAYDRKQADLVYNTPLSDTVRVRVALRAEGQGSYITNEAHGAPNIGYDENYTGRFKLDWRPGDGWDVLYGFEAFAGRDSSNNLYQQVVGAPECQACLLFGVQPPHGFYHTSENKPSAGYNGYIFNTLKITKELGDYTVTNLASYRKSKFYSNADFDATSVNFFNYLYNGTFSTATEDLQVASHYSGRINFIAGLFYLNDRDTADANINGLAFGPLRPGNKGTIATDSASVFADATVTIVHNLTLTIGGRYNYDRKVQTDVNNADAGIVFQSPGFRTAPLEEYSFTPRFVLDYKSDIGTFYVSRTSGFKSGGFTVPAFNIAPSVSPEKIVSYEGGAKLRFLNGRLGADLAVYHYEITNLQVQTTKLPAGTVTLNAASASANGGEFNLRAVVVPGLTLSLGGQVLRANYTSYPNAVFYVPAPPSAGGGYAVTNMDVTGSQIENAPNFSGTGSLNYRFDLPRGWTGDFTALGRYTTHFYFYPGGESPTGGAAQPAFGLLNLSGGINSPNGKYRLGFYATNVTSTRYYELLDYQTTGKLATVAPPAFYGVNLRYNF